MRINTFLINLFKNTSIVFLSFFISLIGLELSLRFFLPYDIARKKEAEAYFEMMYIDNNGHRQLKPSKTSRLVGIRGIDFTVKVNSDGLRDFELKKNGKIGSIESPINKANNVSEAGITFLNLNNKIDFDGFVRKLEVIIPRNGFKKANLKLKVFRRSKGIFNSSVNHFKEIGSSELFKLQPGFHKLKIDNNIKVNRGDIIGMYVEGTTPALKNISEKSKSYYVLGEKNQFSLDVMKSIPRSESYAFTISIENKLSVANNLSNKKSKTFFICW